MAAFTSPIYETAITIEGKEYVFQHTDSFNGAIKMKQLDGTFQSYKPFRLVGRLLTKTKLIGLLKRENAKKAMGVI